MKNLLLNFAVLLCFWVGFIATSPEKRLSAVEAARIGNNITLLNKEPDTLHFVEFQLYENKKKFYTYVLNEMIYDSVYVVPYSMFTESANGNSFPVGIVPKKIIGTHQEGRWINELFIDANF